MMPKGRTGEAMAQIQKGEPSKQTEGNNPFSSHFDHGALIHSYTQEVNGQKNKQELMKRGMKRIEYAVSGPK